MTSSTPATMVELKTGPRRANDRPHDPRSRALSDAKPKGRLGRPPQLVPDRFWNQVDEGEPDECWPWKGYIGKFGYGRFCLHQNTALVPHRFAYELAVGRIPDGLVLDHLCRNRACCNPAHLEPVTPRENLIRGEGFIAENAAKTHCKHGHEFTPENTFTRSDGGRGCCTCRREHYYKHADRRGVKPRKRKYQ